MSLPAACEHPPLPDMLRDQLSDLLGTRFSISRSLWELACLRCWRRDLTARPGRCHREQARSHSDPAVMDTTQDAGDAV